MLDTSQTIGPNIPSGTILQEERLKERENKMRRYMCTVAAPFLELACINVIDT